ncbi:MAG: glycosyltransferase [Erysipelotrichaceae bacterium]|nr:glycosyltransferase [Erysipelotrichaceae bacterium]
MSLRNRKEEIKPLEYSVLMSVYYREKPEFLKQAMDSMFNQSVITDDFVLVCDGPLTEELDKTIEEEQKTHPEILHVVRLDKNSGLGKALNTGMKECRHELIARMDSDDISKPDRCEKQLAVFSRNPEVSIVSGTIEEFSCSIEDIEARRILPEHQEEIVQFARKRNPFNHPCVMYRKSAVEEAGGYQDFYLLEDYYLWIRMLKNGCIGYNIPESLLWMRAGSDMYNRRSGWKYAGSQISLFRYMKENGLITSADYLSSVIQRTIASLVPNSIRENLFKKLLRK